MKNEEILNWLQIQSEAAFTDASGEVQPIFRAFSKGKAHAFGEAWGYVLEHTLQEAGEK